MQGNPAIDLDTIKAILRDTLPIEEQAKVLKEIEKTLKDDKAAEEGASPEEETEEPEPKVKKKTIIVLTALPQELTAKGMSEIPAFVAEIPENVSARDIPDMLRNIASQYRSTKRAKKNPVNTVGELWFTAAAKLFKEYGLGKKSKCAVEVFYVDNKHIS